MRWARLWSTCGRGREPRRGGRRTRAGRARAAPSGCRRPTVAVRGPPVEQGQLADDVAGAERGDLLARCRDTVAVPSMITKHSWPGVALLDEDLAGGDGHLDRRPWRPPAAPSSSRRRRAGPERGGSGHASASHAPQHTDPRPVVRRDRVPGAAANALHRGETVGKQSLRSVLRRGCRARPLARRTGATRACSQRRGVPGCCWSRTGRARAPDRSTASRTGSGCRPARPTSTPGAGRLAERAVQHLPVRPELDPDGVLRSGAGLGLAAAGRGPADRPRCSTASAPSSAATSSPGPGWPEGAPGRNALDVHMLAAAPPASPRSAS